MTKQLEAHIAELQKVLDGPNGKYWAHGPAFKALIAALERSQQYANQRDEENQGLMLTIGRLRVEREQLEAIRAAAEKLVRCKGRYHSEQNYRALAALFGVNTPDLPPLEGEDRPLAVKLPDLEKWLKSDAMCAYRALVIEAIRAAGGTVSEGE